MDQQVHDIRIENWKRLITDANSSGLSKAEWCQQNAIHPKTFYYWQRKIRRMEAEKILGTAALGEAPASTGLTSASGFVDVTHLCREIPPHRSTTSVPVQESFLPQLMLTDGQYRILIGEAVSEKTLTAVLRALRNA